MAAILRVRDGNGNIIELPSLQGESGKSAYEYAQEAGYVGTEEEFAEKLAKELNVRNGAAKGSTRTNELVGACGEYSTSEGIYTSTGDVINGFHIIEFSEWYVTTDFETGAMEGHQAFIIKGGELSTEEYSLLQNNPNGWQIIDELTYPWGDESITFSLDLGNTGSLSEDKLMLVCNEITTLRPGDFPSYKALFLCHPNVTITRYGKGSHTEGYETIAASNYQHVEGKWNAVDRNDTYAHIVGNGSDYNMRSNAYTLDWNGNGVYAGNITAKQFIIATDDGTTSTIATQDYVQQYVEETILGGAW